MKRINLFIAFFAALLLSAVSYCQNKTIDMRVEELLSKMTLEEKVGQMTQFSETSGEKYGMVKKGLAGSFLNVLGADSTNYLQKIAVEQSRLGIPLIFGFDSIHGYRTIFPIPLAESCSWDTMAVRIAEAVSARETRASGIHWAFAPMVDISREPRWGRIAEGSGEDPYLGSAIARARVEGFQGADLSLPTSVLACLKHYVGYGGAESGREYNRVDMSVKTLYETYLPPFKAGIDAGAMSVMSAFNSLSGIPASANRFTLTDVLRTQWGFNGFVVSDWNSITELINHGYASDKAEASVKALHAGVDMDMEGGAYNTALTGLVKEGKVPMSEIDEAVRRILKVKFMLGLFDNPYIDPSLEKKEILSSENISAARDMARKSIVLLKNDRNILPISKDVSTIAVIGPLADSKGDMLGMWSGRGKAEDCVTVIEGIKKAVSPKTKIIYAEGCEINGNDTKKFKEALKAANKADIVLAVVGESAGMSGEAHSRANIGLPGKQLALLKALNATGKPVVMILMNGRPLTIPWEAENIPAILETWHLGVQAGNAIADVLFGDFNPCGKLSVTFPRDVGQIPIYYAVENTGRPPFKERYTSIHTDMPVTPLYPFGYGLSYTTFKYDNLKVLTPEINRYGKVHVSADITNTGKRDGDEIVQFYIRDISASVVRPVRELKGFKKISLKAGETKTVEFEAGPDELGFFDTAGKFIVEPGKFNVWIAPVSNGGLQGEFTVRE